MAGPSLKKCHEQLGRPMGGLHWQLLGHLCAPRRPLGPQGLPAKAGRAPPRLHPTFLPEVPHTPKCGRCQCHFRLLDGTTCRTLVYEFSRKQPETIKELLEIVTQHATWEEAVRAAFALVEAFATVGGGQKVPPIIAATGTKKGAKDKKKARSATRVVPL
jgi:hypothetical protein